MHIKTSALLLTLFASACATTGGGKSSAPFQGADVVTKRRGEIANAGQSAMDCMKVKPGEQAIKGGIFAVRADAAGKLTVNAIKWDGPDAVKQCIVDAAGKTTITALPGPAVGTLWEFMPPGEKSEPQKVPEDLAVKIQPMQDTMASGVTACGQRFLGVDFGATIEVSYFLYSDGQAYAPTVVSSDAKDGGFESCVLDVVLGTKFPPLTVEKPFGATAHFKIGQYGDTQVHKN